MVVTGTSTGFEEKDHQPVRLQDQMQISMWSLSRFHADHLISERRRRDRRSLDPTTTCVYVFDVNDLMNTAEATTMDRSVKR